MSNYSKTTNFLAKDTLISGDPLKVIKGSEHDTEYTNIATAITSKADSSGTVITSGSINGTTIGNTSPSTGAFTTVSATSTVTATTSVVTPLVNSPADLNINTAGVNRWNIINATTNFQPATDNAASIGIPANRISAVFTPIIDSGTTGSLSLKTNNGTTALELQHQAGTVVTWWSAFGQVTVSGGPILRVVSNATNESANIDSKGTGSINLRTAGGNTIGLQIIDIASGNRNVTIASSNGGNPTLSTTAGSLAITPAVVLASTLTGPSNMLSPITNSLGADVLLNNTANYFDGPSVAQGTSGTWFVSGTITIQDTTGAGISTHHAKLWDGTTVIASTVSPGTSASANFCTISLSGFITSPAGNLRISAKDTTTTNGKIVFNQTGNSKDSTITAIRIA